MVLLQTFIPLSSGSDLNGSSLPTGTSVEPAIGSVGCLHLTRVPFLCFFSEHKPHWTCCFFTNRKLKPSKPVSLRSIELRLSHFSSKKNKSGPWLSGFWDSHLCTTWQDARVFHAQALTCNSLHTKVLDTEYNPTVWNICKWNLYPLLTQGLIIKVIFSLSHWGYWRTKMF